MIVRVGMGGWADALGKCIPCRNHPERCACPAFANCLVDPCTYGDDVPTLPVLRPLPAPAARVSLPLIVGVALLLLLVLR